MQSSGEGLATWLPVSRQRSTPHQAGAGTNGQKAGQQKADRCRRNAESRVRVGARERESGTHMAIAAEFCGRRESAFISTPARHDRAPAGNRHHGTPHDSVSSRRRLSARRCSRCPPSSADQLQSVQWRRKKPSNQDPLLSG